ncbi:NUDIX hydrolase [Planctomicrobium sp. SH668]|uniref:NUDIX hydrolase n=1 Tax=Planctomicrobium sp. SH668 TaxID=3448126 RepID=UPI003F5C367D
MFDVCDAEDNVIGQLSRAAVHAQNLLHRAVHIWIWNSNGELLLQLRSSTKDQYPSCYTSSASGHLDAGEDYEPAAVRELNEELQLSGELVYGTKLAASPETAYEHTVLYHLQTDVPAVPDPGEIAEVQFLSTVAIATMLSESPEKFTPPFRLLFGDWWKQEQDQLTTRID